jgi:hypothetical protein
MFSVINFLIYALNNDSFILRDYGSDKKIPRLKKGRGILNKSLAMSYSHMGRPHTTIGAKWFHY